MFVVLKRGALRRRSAGQLRLKPGFLCGDLLRHLDTLRIELFGQRFVTDGKDLRREHSGIFCAVDCHGRYRDAAGHLHGRQQCVEPVDRA